MSENTDYEALKAERDAAMAQVWRLVGENAALTDKAASELSNAWLLHKYWVGIQVALMYIRAGNINDATEWLVGTVSGPGIEAPDLIFTAEIESWAEIQQKDIISHAQAVEIIKAEMSATTQALNEIKAQGVEEYGNLTINIGQDENCEEVIYAGKQALLFAASLRGE
ncbi:hypothetical protein N4224_05300 [Yersinia enterocolitica]|uniref:hypothetical protein n=1 Tax=Yersinia enterocolitica TaxID=630 RepID=UPI0021E7CD4D|nr:hypothetical protein [Yersinia enterocolitica]UYJ86127.1 hypothetical protein N4W04_05290 [Yersinia enterocolitica]UYK15508.1 hypothetical protein N4224_05300 [Yersinia enterocolitica]HDL8447537.1 hypothetical protein [Yersinia enterocolitica]HDL8483712.1 hypothetical protein [Yersinia enterocolitica]HDY4894565.1 hypothetical protein [Yersinia enterocolitica]